MRDETSGRVSPPGSLTCGVFEDQCLSQIKNFAQ